jgi:hypothetical protein
MLGPQDVQSNLTARAIINRDLFDVDCQRAHWTRLRLFKGSPSLLGTKSEQQREPGRSLNERLRLGF